MSRDAGWCAVWSLRLLRVSIAHGSCAGAAMLACAALLLHPSAPAQAAEPAVSSSPPLATGDALFDRYAAALDARITAWGMQPTAEITAVAALPDTILAGWQREFGADPRYWELRYLCAVTGAPETALADGFSAPVDFLAQVRTRGLASANSLLLLYNELHAVHAAQLTPPADTAPGAVDLSAEMQRYEQEELELLDAAVAAGPLEAWPYYIRGWYWLELGEQDRGLADLAAGNAAPINAFPRPWPLAYVAQSALQSAAPGGEAVCGAIALLGMRYPQDNFMLAKGLMLDTAVCGNLDGKLSRCEAWHQFGCRLAGAMPENPQYSVYGTVFILSARPRADLAQDLQPAQTEVLQRIMGACIKGRAIILDCAKLYPAQTEVEAALRKAASPREAAASGLIFIRDEARCYPPLAAIFADLAQVHYPQLELPECLRQYEPMTTDEATEYKAQQKQQRITRGQGL